MKRVMIIGCGGIGKSTLAVRLGEAPGHSRADPRLGRRPARDHTWNRTGGVHEFVGDLNPSEGQRSA